MQIVTLRSVPTEQLEAFLRVSDNGKSIMSQLASSQTGNDRTVTPERINYIKHSADHLMFLCLDDDQLLGMIVGQRVTGINTSYFYIHDVVVSPEARGGGIGSKLMQTLMDAAGQEWPEIVRMQLTSRPSRGTGPFFQKFGFRARTKENDDETIVYVKDLGNYHS
jgi:ribosomal protein S18 acetylase RimI-like enzyme